MIQNLTNHFGYNKILIVIVFINEERVRINSNRSKVIEIFKKTIS